MPLQHYLITCKEYFREHALIVIKRVHNISYYYSKVNQLCCLHRPSMQMEPVWSPCPCPVYVQPALRSRRTVIQPGWRRDRDL